MNKKSNEIVDAVVCHLGRACGVMFTLEPNELTQIEIAAVSQAGLLILQAVEILEMKRPRLKPRPFHYEQPSNN